MFAWRTQAWGRCGFCLALFVAGCSSSSNAANGAPSDAGADGDASIGEDPASYVDRPMRDQIAAIEGGKITSAGLTQAYLARIDARDRGDGGINSIIVLDPNAVAHATELDGKRGKGALLEGAVILVKDNIDTQGIATTAGSLALAANVPAKDSHVVARLHDAQALVFGKTNLSEWANFRGDKASSGWSSVGGQTNNGANAAYNPCGSSSGSAAAVAAGLASAALGTETNGSITCPASVNGVVGFKPTVGLVSRAGVIPISNTQDTAGPITRTVSDAARLLSVIAGADPDDPATQTIPAGTSLDFEAPLASATLSGKRFGAVKFGFPSPVTTLFAQERARIVAAGATVVDITLDTSSWNNDEYAMLLTEFKVGINVYLASHARAGQSATLQELIDFNTAHAAQVMPFFGQEVFIAAQATNGLSDPAYLTAKQSAADAAGKNGIAAALAANNLDALISPTASPAWKTNHAMGDPGIVTSSAPAAVARYPHLTVPMGQVGGLPVGLSIFAKAWDDAKVLALGYAYEQLPR